MDCPAARLGRERSEAEAARTPASWAGLFQSCHSPFGQLWSSLVSSCELHLHNCHTAKAAKLANLCLGHPTG